jgi:hypothetical protein
LLQGRGGKQAGHGYKVRNPKVEFRKKPEELNPKGLRRQIGARVKASPFRVSAWSFRAAVFIRHSSFDIQNSSTAFEILFA